MPPESPIPVPDKGIAGRALLAALGFLTRVPLGHARPLPGDLVAAAPLFPLVGAALGALVGAIAAALALALPALLAGTLAVALELALTGALHADGLADSADGLAGRDRDDALAVMRDHSLGTYGASALGLGLLVKAAAIGVLAENDAVLPVAAAFAVSRAAPLPLAAALPYARPGTGTGLLLAERMNRSGAVAGVALAATLAVAATGASALASLACLAVAAGTVGAVSRRRLGGVTGDTMGASIELTAMLALVVAVGLQG
jgi:adenosylcobinamide-GDP ribazoletransferase